MYGVYGVCVVLLLFLFSFFFLLNLLLRWLLIPLLRWLDFSHEETYGFTFLVNLQTSHVTVVIYFICKYILYIVIIFLLHNKFIQLRLASKRVHG